MTRRRFVVIGGGVNGLTAAFYLARAGHSITLLERERVVGGAGRLATANIVPAADSTLPETFTYPLGATLLGQMQRFVFDDMRLGERVQVGPAPHPAYYFFEDAPEAFRFHEEPDRLQALAARLGWDLHGLEDFEADAAKVVSWIRHGFHQAIVPTAQAAEDTLGKALADLWIAGSAKNLLDHYLRDERLKVVFGKDIVESGPVSLTEPGTALNVPLLDSGSVFDGRWGYVRGGMGKLLEAMAAACREAGVRIETGATVQSANPRSGRCRYQGTGARAEHRTDFDHVVFATDPATAARLCDDIDILLMEACKSVTGTSGKLIMIFRRPVRWKDSDGTAEFDAALKFFLHHRSLDEIDEASRRVETGQDMFVRGYYEMYCEGAGQRMLGNQQGFETVMAFFKHLAFGYGGEDLAEVRERVLDDVLGHTANGRGELLWSRLVTPADIRNEFHIACGNIDHIMLSGDQTGWKRRHSLGNSSARFYQFGNHANATYCGAGSYPFGSIAGTAGYMAATELLRSL